jgi:peptidoglycan/xylan/chitin deacetylase (PgdA/CDA1 family)
VGPDGAPPVWHRVEGAGSRLALTFDDCDRPGAWADILDVLADMHTTATFFANGMRVVEQPALARRTVAAGHAVGSHGWDHTRLPGLSPDDVRRRLQADHRAWSTVTGATPRPWFRPPYGALDDVVVETAREAGYSHTVLWDVDPEDWKEPGARAVAERVVSGAGPGSIVGMHVVEDTAEALPSVIDALRGRGMELVTVPALVGAALAGAGRRR